MEEFELVEGSVVIDGMGMSVPVPGKSVFWTSTEAGFARTTSGSC